MKGLPFPLEGLHEFLALLARPQDLAENKETQENRFGISARPAQSSTFLFAFIFHFYK